MFFVAAPIRPLSIASEAVFLRTFGNANGGVQKAVN
jgi:hypothetical protein